MTIEEITVGFIPVLVVSIIGVVVKMQISERVNDLRVKTLEGKVEHLSNNWKQRDVILMRLIENLRKEIHEVSLQLATMQGKQQKHDKHENK
jgi:hypothetical protein